MPTGIFNFEISPDGTYGKRLLVKFASILDDGQFQVTDFGLSVEADSGPGGASATVTQDQATFSCFPASPSNFNVSIGVSGKYNDIAFKITDESGANDPSYLPKMKINGVECLPNTETISFPLGTRDNTLKNRKP